MSKIYVEFMTDEAIQTIKANVTSLLNVARDNKISNAWLTTKVKEKPFIEKKYQIEDFELEIAESGNYKEVDFYNSIKLYEHLKHLPRYVLSDERFWAWLNFGKFYPVARQAIDITDKPSSLLHHYLFCHGTRRSMFFGVLSRCYLRVYLTVDDNAEDKYELTRFAIENPERIRNLTWRASSNSKKLVRGVLKAEKKAAEKHGLTLKNSFYKQIAKEVYRLGSVILLDAMTEEEISIATFKIIERLLAEAHEK